MRFGRSTHRSLLAGVSLLMGFACAGVPGTRPVYQVLSVDAIGPLLDVKLEWTGRERDISSDRLVSLLFQSADECTQWISVGNEVVYKSGGLMGSVERGEQSCDSVGISDLRQWRDRRPRRRVARPGDDRAQATYRVVFDGPDYAIIRGRFPLGGMIGWYGGADALALIPRIPDCAAVLGREVATMEFRDSGPNALSLVGEGRCPIVGFAKVVPALRDPGEAASR